ncbi:PilX N-terminal domain-containing pilus assembly protein [Xylophilus sp. GOD-11R]|uniref:pilus assembly PilX family protein n=1 Tax=Xylophilus sp. GOD-11R TaxID=3089814 RepID=UPI00298BCD1E|nr:PilX N-terminal domain-containing pilus assembly protein [Xylophilus sp. GOD-11R]WPB55069.1 pilus assembly protein PilX [Xylophilus sp. GOD-11R]
MARLLVRPRQQQRGVALVVVLLFLVALTGIAVVAARKALVSEGTGRNQLDMAVAREAAESAMRDAERDLYGAAAINPAAISCTRPQAMPMPSDFTPTCSNGLCVATEKSYAESAWTETPTTTKSEPWWPQNRGGLWNNIFDSKPSRTPVGTSNCNFTGGVPLGTYTGAPPIRGVRIQPEYLVEYFRRRASGGQEVDAYRITTRGFGYSPRTQIVLQSVYSPEQ